MQFIEDSTKGRLTLGAGTLYGALNSLQEKGWIAPFGDSAGRKKEYLITTQGKEIAEKELIRPVSYTHLDVYKRQAMTPLIIEPMCILRMSSKWMKQS